MVNFDARGVDDDLVLIECNPRPWFTMQLAMLAGTNFAAFWLDEIQRRRGAAAIERSLPLFPGGLIPSHRGLPWAHAAHMLRDAGYYLSADISSRIAALLRGSGSALD